MNKMTRSVFYMVLFLAVVSVGVVQAEYVYKVNKEHLGGDVTPVEAWEMLKKDPGHVFLVDCRTRAEYQYVGYPEGAYNVPSRFLSIEAGEKGYVEKANPNFIKDLLARFNPATDTLLIICRSGNRSAGACNEAVKAGFRESHVFNVMGGFEGGKSKVKGSSLYGRRIGGSWKNEGLPWTYAVKSELMYKPDIQSKAK